MDTDKPAALALIEQDNHMTFGGHIVYFVARVASFAPEREAQMMLRGTQINYMTDKSHAIIIIINTQGQIVQIHLIRKFHPVACCLSPSFD